MEKFLSSYDKESMKRAMLKHEEIFREQVCELHRLYQIQKMLMREIAKDRRNYRQDFIMRNSNQFIHDDHDIRLKVRNCLDLERLGGEFIAESGDGRVPEEVGDYNDLELTLGPKSYYMRGKAANTPPKSGLAPSISSTSAGSNHIKKTRKYASEESLNQKKWGIEIPLAANSGFLGGRKNSTSSEVEEHLRPQDRLNTPPWLFQALSLNMS